LYSNICISILCVVIIGMQTHQHMLTSSKLRNWGMMVKKKITAVRIEKKNN
jgi:hypothetical protein